jgi:predicted nucleic acid-binding protein
LIVADASLMISWLLNETDVVVAEDVYNLLAEDTLLVPAHWPVEVANALRTNVRRGRLSPAVLEIIQERLGKLVIVPDASVSPADIAALVVFAVDQRLTTYDACYVQLAARSRAPLATLDRDMRAAAARLNIDVLPS